MNTHTRPTPLDPEQVLDLIQRALIEQQVTPTTGALCALPDESEQIVALQSAALLDVLWDGILIDNPDVSTVFWAQVGARLHEQRRLDTLLPYIDTQSTLFGISVQPQCAFVLELALLHVAAHGAQLLESQGKDALQDMLEQLDENLVRMRTLVGEQFELLFSPSYMTLDTLATQTNEEGQEALRTCAQVIAQMLVSALSLETEALAA